jgi:oligoribonuclease NrnB/cAMP/cGMP phosphodiesterase (DHH superfamily)
MSVLIIYHDRCPDGAAAAWCANKALTESGETCVMHPAVHGTDPPLKKARAADKTYILDFSYDRLKMLKLASITDLKVLDHHASAEAQCHGLDFCEFDMNRSGAGMSWDHFFPGEERPWFIDYIEDRDIWKWQWPNSRAALAYIDTMPKTFETYDKLLDGEPNMGECVERGSAICEYIDQYNTQSIEASLRLVDFQAPNGDIHMDIPMVNVSMMGISLVVNEIAKGSKFALGWFRRNDGKYQFSIRVSADSDFDATKLAACYGGGGHVKASGFQLDHELEELPTTRIE